MVLTGELILSGLVEKVFMCRVNYLSSTWIAVYFTGLLMLELEFSPANTEISFVHIHKSSVLLNLFMLLLVITFLVEIILIQSYSTYIVVALIEF